MRRSWDGTGSRKVKCFRNRRLRYQVASQLRRSLYALLVIVVLLPHAGPAGVQAQSAAPTLPAINTALLDLQSPEDVLSAADRDRAFSDLADEAEAIHRQMGHLKRVVKLVRPSIVHIEARKPASSQSDDAMSDDLEEAGSGVIVEWDQRFYVLTNRHVVQEAELRNIHITLYDARRLHPVRAASDPGTDVAILEVREAQLVPARIGNSDQIEIGDFVLAYGSPFGLSHSVTYGIISAKGRRDLELSSDGVVYQDFIQTDAAINPGNSGGPLVNLRGEIVGINTAIASSSGGNEGIGFSIPINMVIFVAKQLVDHGRVTRAQLGVHWDDSYDAEAAAQLGLPRLVGARISGVKPNSPGELAELNRGDVILRFDGIPVENGMHLKNLVGLTTVGRQVPVVVFRDGRYLTKQIKVSDSPTAAKP